jgi:hypothetical protein
VLFPQCLGLTSHISNPPVPTRFAAHKRHV